MNFFGLGPGELLAIAVLALVVVRPKQLPSLLKQMGGWFGKAQEMQRELRRGVDDIVRETELGGVTKTISQVQNFTPAGAAKRFVAGEFENVDSREHFKVNAKGVEDDGFVENSQAGAAGVARGDKQLAASTKDVDQKAATETDAVKASSKQSTKSES